MTPQFREIELNRHSSTDTINGVNVPVIPIFAQEGKYLFYLKFNSTNYDVCMVPPRGDAKNSKTFRVPSFPYTLAEGESITKLKLLIAKKLFGVLTENLGESENYLYITNPEIREINNKESIRIYVAVMALVRA